MSFANFDDINRICIEMGEDKEVIGTMERMVVKLQPGQEEQPFSKRWPLFEDEEMFP
ncbi:hypothetical protein PP175_23635 [Aneurinibacillus sp. Ricciae_BoGa-3]|uniref:hypothetical protein n=1 Tax=Aneurinibacillus sp. Ricciae_BoGa-3 TaxID=3022697 RepID=UPI0023405FF0|nr:hypothetical protein [Aneurinibacillus sp. Ricciae_BoGa-3]WCK54244.1 hypothetical protein PP175_23635 [Aneurinibacillus sp. Ricciae_BoGa-3]